jgi:(R,R)-butanediol dehydrogenase/meso-butanediol dehydrogenase/diacetyl reductase
VPVEQGSNYSIAIEARVLSGAHHLEKNYITTEGVESVKAVLLKEPRKVSIVDIPIPKISDDEVLVGVKYCGICATDVHAYAGDYDAVGPPFTGFMRGAYLGHEFSGVLAEVGKNVEGWEVGDRVAVKPTFRCGKCYGCMHGLQSQCNEYVGQELGTGVGDKYAGAYSKFVRVPLWDWRLERLPKEVSFEEGALVEPLACGMHGVRKSSFKLGDEVMVIGAGPIGLGVILFLKQAGAGLISAIEANEKRAAVAMKFGADYVLNPLEDSHVKGKVLKSTNGKGVDLVFDCSGTNWRGKDSPLDIATSVLRKGGQIVIESNMAQKSSISVLDFSVNEWRLQGSLAYNVDDFPAVLDFMRKGVMPVKEMITKKIKASDIVAEGFEVLMRPDHKEVKILVEPDE